jgi:hypothetical protein
MKRREFLVAAGSLSAAVAVRSGLAFGSPCPPTPLSLDGDSATTACVNGVSNAAYVNSMSAFEVRQLTGVYAPTNGKETILSITRSGSPYDWLNGDPGNTGVRSITEKWSGGAGDPSTGKLYIMGGGHTDSANNGLHVYDFNGAEAPAGFSIASQSPTTAVVANSGQYSDGQPSSGHTYDGMATVDGKVYWFGGGSYNNGNFGNATWKFESGAWTKLTNVPVGMQAQPSCVLDPISKQILVWSISNNGMAFFSTTSNSYVGTSATSNTSGWPYNCLAYDSTRSIIYNIGSGVYKRWTVNWASHTLTESTYTPSGSSFLASSHITPLYDPTRDRFWIFGGSAGAGYSNIYEMHPTSFVVTPHVLSAPIPAPNTTGDTTGCGSYKRAVFVNNYSAIGFVSNVSSPAVVIKLP